MFLEIDIILDSVVLEGTILIHVLIKQMLANTNIWRSRTSSKRLNILKWRVLTMEQRTRSVVEISGIGAVSFVSVLVRYLYGMLLIRQIDVLALTRIGV